MRPPPRALEPLLLLLLVALAVGPGAWAEGHVVGDGVDLFGTIWFFGWIEDCLRHLRDPSFTDWMFFPLGKDIFAHTGNNFVDALLSVPFQWIFGHPDYQPVFTGVVLLGNGLAMRPLARQVLGAGWGALAATLLFASAPAILFEVLTGRVTQALWWFAPGAIAAFLRLLAPGPLRRGDVLRAGLLTAAQAWTYWFAGAFLALGFAYLVADRLLVAPRRAGAILGRALLAGLVCALPVAPAVVAMALQGESGSVPGLVGDPASPWAPPQLLPNNVGPTLHGLAEVELHGNPLFTTWTWGLGLAAAALFGAGRRRWLGFVGLLLFMAFGPDLPSPWGPLPHPLYRPAYNLVPFIDRLWFPYRIGLLASLGAALAIGAVIARAERGRWPWVAPVLAAVVLLGNAVEQHRWGALPLLHRPLRAPEIVRWAGAEGGAFIELPMGMAKETVAWQIEHRQPTFGGMAENAMVFWPPGHKARLGNRFLRFLRDLSRDPTPPPRFTAGDRRRVQEEGFRWVFLDRQLYDAELRSWPWARTAPPAALGQAVFTAQARLSQALGAPPIAVDGPLVVWDLHGGATPPPHLRPTTATLWTRTWAPPKLPAYEETLQASGRLRR